MTHWSLLEMVRTDLLQRVRPLAAPLAGAAVGSVMMRPWPDAAWLVLAAVVCGFALLACLMRELDGARRWARYGPTAAHPRVRAAGDTR